MSNESQLPEEHRLTEPKNFWTQLLHVELVKTKNELTALREENEKLKTQYADLEKQQAFAHSYIIDIREFLKNYVTAFDKSEADDYNFRDDAESLYKRKFSKP